MSIDFIIMMVLCIEGYLSIGENIIKDLKKRNIVI